MNPEDQTNLDAAVLRRLLEHLRDAPEVQNIDLMNLAGFCRNCLSKWYVAAADDAGIQLDLDGAREHVYGMPYGEWKDRYQKPASAEQIAQFEQAARSD